MKFKCIIVNHSKLKEFLGIINTLGKHNDTLIIISRPDSMSFTVPQDPKMPYVWFDINSQPFFSVYNMEGVNPHDTEGNKIYFEVKASYLVSSLATKKRTPDYAEIKLGKQDFPFFTINMKFESKDLDKPMLATSKVPIIIVPRVNWDSHELPYNNSIPFKVQGMAPRLHIFKRFLDSFKTSNTVKIVLRKDKVLSIESNSHEGKHHTYFSNIEVMNCRNKDDVLAEYDGPPVAALIDQRKLSNWLNSITFPSHHPMSVMIEDKYMKLFFRVRDEILCNLVMATEIDAEDEFLEDSD